MVLLRFPWRRPAPLPGTLRWGDFLIGQKVTKDPPKAGPSPALWNPPRGTERRMRPPISALGPVRSHRWRENSTESACFFETECFSYQGLTQVCNCSQLPEAWLPAAETPLGQGRPGGGNHPVIGPVTRVAWCGGTNRDHSKGNGPNTSLTQAQPRTPRGVLRGERPKRVLVSFARSKETPSGERPPAGKPEPGKP